MIKIRNIVFVLLITLLCFSAVGNKLMHNYLDGYSAQRVSMLEGRKYQSFPRGGIKSFFNNSFQSKLEQFIADFVPGRDCVIIINARLQRFSIELANIFAGYSVYPTYYGSSYCFVPGRNAIMEKPYYLSKRKITASLEEYVALIEANDIQQWVFAMPLRPGVFAEAEALRLVSNNTDYAWIEKNFSAKLPEGCEVVSLSCNTAEDYYNQYYKTDHHWRMQGAVRAYEDVIRAFGRAPVKIEDYYIAYEGPFWGSAARAGACIEGSGDVVFDVIYDSAVLSITGPYGPLKSNWIGGSNGRELYTYEKPEQFSNVYSDYFHTDVAYLEINNCSGSGQGTLLIVGDSSTNCLERLFAQNYTTVYILDLRYYEKTVQEFLETHEIDDALLMLTANDFVEQDVVDKLY